MKVRPSTVAIGGLGLALTAAGVTPLLAIGLTGIGNWFVWCIMAMMIGIPVALGAVAREIILRAPAGKYRNAIATGFLGGIGLGGGGVGDGSGDGGGGDGGAH